MSIANAHNEMGEGKFPKPSATVTVLAQIYDATHDKVAMLAWAKLTAGISATISASAEQKYGHGCLFLNTASAFNSAKARVNVGTITAPVWTQLS